MLNFLERISKKKKKIKTKKYLVSHQQSIP